MARATRSPVCISRATPRTIRTATPIASASSGECDGVTIKNLSVYGTAMAETRMVGGLAGRTCGVSTHRRSTVENCHNYVTLAGSATNDDIFSHGGLVGSAQETDFIGCSNEVDITGYQGQVGGIVGNTGIGGVTLTNCWSSRPASICARLREHV